MNELFEDIRKKFPFIALINVGSNEYVGIIQNQNAQVTSMYDYSKLKSEDEKESFLKAGETWWNESNRLIPINIFLREEMKQFRHTMQTHNTKEVKVISGHIVNLNNMRTRRVKRRTLTLVRKVK
jgi:hypothetical protein|tara:strand:+ start:632 stop:1006 length:375 start_codon:yes stop_codon:yes gene_type:complete